MTDIDKLEQRIAELEEKVALLMSYISTAESCPTMSIEIDQDFK